MAKTSQNWTKIYNKNFSKIVKFKTLIKVKNFTISKKIKKTLKLVFLNKKPILSKL